jgi:hypothetical protein
MEMSIQMTRRMNLVQHPPPILTTKISQMVSIWKRIQGFDADDDRSAWAVTEKN